VVSSDSIELAWEDTSGGTNQEVGFEIQRASRTLREYWITIAFIGADITTYADTEVIPSTRYAYQVRAMNDAGVSPWSNRVHIMTPG
jgi:hypothetical protein